MVVGGRYCWPRVNGGLGMSEVGSGVATSTAALSPLDPPGHGTSSFTWSAEVEQSSARCSTNNGRPTMTADVALYTRLARGGRVAGRAAGHIAEGACYATWLELR